MHTYSNDLDDKPVAVTLENESEWKTLRPCTYYVIRRNSAIIGRRKSIAIMVLFVEIDISITICCCCCYFCYFRFFFRRYFAVFHEFRIKWDHSLFHSLTMMDSLFMACVTDKTICQVVTAVYAIDYRVHTMYCIQWYYRQFNAANAA